MPSGDLEAIVAIALAEAAARITAAVASAQAAANATTQSATTQANADIAVANITANANKFVGQLNETADIQVAGAQASAAIQVAQFHTQGTTYTADKGLESTTVESDADKAVATTTSDAQKDIAHTNATADVQVAGIAKDGEVSSAELHKEGVEYTADKGLTGIQSHETAETLRLQRTLDFAQDKWNQVWPLVAGFINNGLPNSGQGAINWSGLIAALGAAPWISQGGVWSPSQIQQQLNALYARSDARAQTLFHDAQVDLAGRGFGGASPLLDVLRFSYEAENLETSTEGASQLALKSAETNSELVLNQQKLRQEQYASNERFFAELDKIGVDLTTGLFGSVAQIIGSLGR